MPKTCAAINCDRPHYSNGLCCTHRRQQARGIAPQPIRPRTTPEDRYHSAVVQAPGCWHWSGRINHAGYGVMTIENRNVLAHRFSYELLVGPIPPGAEIDHICHTRDCSNPDHLRPVTHALNHQNRSGAQSNSKSGVRGVSWDRRKGKWVVAASVRGRKHYGGWFDDLRDAEQSAIALRLRIMTHSERDRNA